MMCVHNRFLWLLGFLFLVMLPFQNCQPFESSQFFINEQGSITPGPNNGNINDNTQKLVFSDVSSAVFETRCLACHSGGNPQGGLDLSSYQALTAGSSVIPGDPQNSELVKRVLDGSMPPGAPLEDPDIQLISDWIEDGALESANNSPSVSVGNNKEVQLPESSVTIEATASDSDGTITTQLWEQIDGPIQATIDSPQTLSTAVSNLSQPGTYQFRITVYDDAGAESSASLSVVVKAKEETPMPMPNPDPPAINQILAIGDSLSAGIARNYRKPLAELTKVDVANHGIGGQRSNEIAARMGVTDIQITASSSISSTNRVRISSINNPPITAQGRQSISCVTQSGISCELTRNNGTYYIQVSQPTNSRDLVVRIPKPNIDEKTLGVIWVGRNNAGQHSLIVNDSKKLAELFTSKNAEYVVLAVPNTSRETKGSGGYRSIIHLNSLLADAHGQRFIGIREILVDRYDPNNSQDRADYNNDVVPGSLRIDAIHLNQKGYDIVADEIYKKFKELGAIK